MHVPPLLHGSLAHSLSSVQLPSSVDIQPAGQLRKFQEFSESREGITVFRVRDSSRVVEIEYGHYHIKYD